jgi:hypothetical protein
MWEYRLDGGVISHIRRPDDDLPYIGMPICMVGRLGKLAPAENFIVTGFDAQEKWLTLEYAK